MKGINRIIASIISIAAIAATAGCTSAWWDVSMSPYDNYDSPVSPPPYYYLPPSRPVFGPNNWGLGWGGPNFIPGNSGGIFNPPPSVGNRPNQQPKPNPQRPGGNVNQSIGGQTTVPVVDPATLNGGAGSNGTGQRRGGNAR